MNKSIDDARHFVRTTSNKYEVVIFDIVFGENQPSHLFTVEGFREIQTILEPNGILLVNFQGTLDQGQAALGAKSIGKTLEAAGFTVNQHQEESADSVNQDIIFLADMSDMDLSKALASIWFNEWTPNIQFQPSELISDQKVDYSSGYLLTDDQPRLELINSRTILGWRTASLTQNRKKMLQAGFRLYH
ncbi:MAG: hypothetical protein AAF399_09855 [Bacteroidota bacterium]